MSTAHQPELDQPDLESDVSMPPSPVRPRSPDFLTCNNLPPDMINQECSSERVSIWKPAPVIVPVPSARIHRSATVGSSRSLRRLGSAGSPAVQNEILVTNLAVQNEKQKIRWVRHLTNSSWHEAYPSCAFVKNRASSVPSTATRARARTGSLALDRTAALLPLFPRAHRKMSIEKKMELKIAKKMIRAGLSQKTCDKFLAKVMTHRRSCLVRGSQATAQSRRRRQTWPRSRTAGGNKKGVKVLTKVLRNLETFTEIRQIRRQATKRDNIEPVPKRSNRTCPRSRSVPTDCHAVSLPRNAVCLPPLAPRNPGKRVVIRSQSVQAKETVLAGKPASGGSLLDSSGETN